MFFAFDSDTSSSPYDSLSNLCTILVIAEEASDVPLQPLFHTISGALQKGRGDGDVVVMAARALGLLLDKFSRCFSHSEKDKVSKIVKNCFENVFSWVKKREVNLKHEKTTVRELKEELLNCLSLAGNCSGISSVVPSTEEQLKFCFNALDGSKWTSCKVLQYCIGLIRRGELKDTGDHKVVEQLLHHHLSSLCHLDIDHEWDELLRIVVEGIITYRIWREKSMNTTLPKIGRKRQRREEENMIRNNNTFSNETSMKSMETSLLAIGERIFTSGSAESRLQLTLACIASVMETSSSPLERNKKEFEWLCKLLQHTATRSAGYSSPFAYTREKTSKRDQLWVDTFQALPNLQWIVPPLVWSALIVLSKLCGANFGFRKEYMWAWRGDGGEYYPYSRAVRQQLTSMFFSAQTSRKVLQTRHIFDLGSMTDTSALTLVVSRIHFQPIPSVLTFDGKLMMPAESLKFSEEMSSLLQETLRSLSFGHTQVATLARAIRLYVICSGIPVNRDEGVVAAFRSLHAEQKRSVVEDISAVLLQRDKRWAPILLEAGVADALTQLPVSTTTADKTTYSTATSQRSPPLVELIRSAGSSPQLTPIKLPDLVDFPRFLQHASSEEMLSFIEGLEHVTLSETSLLEVCGKIKKDAGVIRRMRSATHTYILRVLHQTSVTQQEGKSLVNRVCDASDVISICAPEKNTSNYARCPKGHPLRIHFSINWRCNLCNSSNAFGSLACRDCDYDLCSECSNAKLSRMDVSMTAVVGDIIRGWRECRSKEQVRENSSSEKINHTVLFTAKGILPSGFSASTLRGEEVHFAEVDKKCECGISVPSSIANLMEHIPSYSPLKIFLHTFDALEQWNDIEPAIVDALESCGAEIFERGITGIPLRVIHVIQAIAPYISLSFKRDTAHFLAVGCRRFGLYHLQDVNARVRGMIVGDISSNGLATKVSVKRETEAITQTLFNTFIQYPTLRNKVEFNFEGEEGTGEGPTQELYAEVSRRYRDMTKLWHERDDGSCIAFPTLKQVYSKEFYVLGACCGRAFVDGYTMDIDLLPIVWPFIRSQSYSPELYWRVLSELEPALTNSYNHLLNSTDEELAEMGIEQDEHGTLLTASTAKAYVQRCVEEHLTHALMNLHWFSLGLCGVVDPRAFLLLTDEEMSVVLCGSSGPDDGSERLFGEAALRAALVEAHGYAAGSREVGMFAAIVGGEFTREQQRLFLEFLTGSPRLPLNGLAGLARKITVVRKELEGRGEQTLPSCNTCFLYFKLPPYSTHDIMKERLLTAITEGRQNFSLS
ncbi:putative ubiquitin-protein ligase [Trypanosoma theileri]|uniref:Putative ubiquitin-protein ligase n=1 Tax=Trypanosoma theileri TaxID=67003 RepID=A0A1X0PAF7_9TRYP|nr:putative ubiquitin-protein ligase [Trypanosoma theileri]ORC93805.1 putative ubiquitin-protein ligase [Trypanosoma theileri]